MQVEFIAVAVGGLLLAVAAIGGLKVGGVWISGVGRKARVLAAAAGVVTIGTGVALGRANATSGGTMQALAEAEGTTQAFAEPVGGVNGVGDDPPPFSLLPGGTAPADSIRFTGDREFAWSSDEGAAEAAFEARGQIAVATITVTSGDDQWETRSWFHLERLHDGLYFVGTPSNFSACMDGNRAACLMNFHHLLRVHTDAAGSWSIDQVCLDACAPAKPSGS